MKAAITLALAMLIAGTAFAQKQNGRLQPSCSERKIQFDVHTAKGGTDTNVETGKSQVYVLEVAERAFLLDTRKNRPHRA
jgi:hypothetical protein